ncbi:hypothetical protein [Geoalkalibacter halelectricus]|uniref:hypothetical protein n=1 Tax=Geoalkalibacter halelectricus TaxID=2847045 RepID=UPI003D234E0E
MTRTRQKGLRLQPEEERDLKRIAEYRRRFLASVEQGWVEIRCGLGEVVDKDDDFFEVLSKEIRKSDLSPGQ